MKIKKKIPFQVFSPAFEACKSVKSNFRLSAGKIVRVNHFSLVEKVAGALPTNQKVKPKQTRITFDNPFKTALPLD